MYIVISQAFDRFAEGVGHGLVGVWVDDEDPDRRHFVLLIFSFLVEKGGGFLFGPCGEVRKGMRAGERCEELKNQLL